ncbi:MAG: hypothetical protein LBT09_09400 [Planctomycetaceae bacterium]|nr:hypothetical protein [Planctomycetaceae bacterium]
MRTGRPRSGYEILKNYRSVVLVDQKSKTIIPNFDQPARLFGEQIAYLVRLCCY